MLSKLRQNNSGFTIIEVLIVLAIAGLIMVMVFVAVPNLQRNQRNSARRSDASHILTAATNRITSGNGVMPQVNRANAQGIYDDGQPYDRLAGMTVPATMAAGLQAGEVRMFTGAQDFRGTDGRALVADQAVAIVTNAECDNANIGSTLGAPASERKIAIVFTLETPSGMWQLACNNS